MGHGNGMFSSKPQSFKIRRGSPVASNLRSSISDKLLHFLGNFTDDVLADYITVLVCNGKHQYQARDDLEAFLGERSGEFVSWLWDLLFKSAHQANEAIGLLEPKDATDIDCDGNKDSGINRSRDFQNHGTGHASDLMTEDVKIYHPSTSACNHFPSNDTEQAEGFPYHPGSAAHLYEVNSKKVLSKTCRNELLRRVGSTENINDNTLAHESSGKENIFLIPLMDKPKKSNRLHKQLLHLPKRELVFRDLRSSASEYPCPKQICATNVLRSLTPRSVGAVSHQNEKSQGSVWDRLGKPCDDIYLSSKTVEVHGVGIMKQDDEVLNQRTSMHPVPNGELSRSMAGEVLGLGDRRASNNPAKSRQLEHGVSTMCEHAMVNNIRRKRHFGEIIDGPGVGSISPVGERNIDLQTKGTLITKDSKTTPNLVSEVLDVRQRLCQIEMEISKLRSKQVEKKKDGKPCSLSCYGALKHPQDDIESRTVFVTNVHFVATKEALSMYFSKCGMIDNVVILTDKATAQPNGTAYVTFASKESVDKALSLRGSTFFSRTVKVLRKAEAATLISAPAQLAGKPSQATLSSSHLSRKAMQNRPYYPCSHLQWRRESVSAPSESSAPASVEVKGVTESTSQQQHPSHLHQ